MLLQASVAGPNYVKFLKDLAEEQKFAVTYVELDEPVEGGGWVLPFDELFLCL